MSDAGQSPSPGGLRVDERQICAILCDQLLAALPGARSSAKLNRAGRLVQRMIGNLEETVGIICGGPLIAIVSWYWLADRLGRIVATVVALGVAAAAVMAYLLLRRGRKRRKTGVRPQEIDEETLSPIYQTIDQINSFHPGWQSWGIELPLLELHDIDQLERDVGELRRRLGAGAASGPAG